MNYFELYGLPVQLALDAKQVKEKYFELSRRYHPDYFVQQGEDAQQQALEQSTLVNNAFKTFSSEMGILKYVLELKGLLTENEKYDLPPAFLMEMMELNESFMEAQTDPAERNKVAENVRQAEVAIYQPVEEIIKQYQEGKTLHSELLLVKDYYFKKKYLERLKQQLGELS